MAVMEEGDAERTCSERFIQAVHMVRAYPIDPHADVHRAPWRMIAAPAGQTTLPIMPTSVERALDERQPSE